MSLFKNAAKLPAKQTAKAKNEKVEIALSGIQQLAEVKAMMDGLAAMAKTLETGIKDAGFEKFLEMETTVRPESFKGIDGQATASVEMRKRGTNSALNDDEVKVLKELNLEPFEQVVQTEMYGINPVFAADEKLMEKVSKALEKIVPEGFIVLQEGVKKNVVDEKLLDAAFALPHGSDERKTALAICTTMALKPRLNEDYDMTKLGANVAALMGAVDETVTELEAEGARLVSKTDEVPTAKPARKTRKATAAA